MGPFENQRTAPDGLEPPEMRVEEAPAPSNRRSRSHNGNGHSISSSSNNNNNNNNTIGVSARTTSSLRTKPSIASSVNSRSTSASVSDRFSRHSRAFRNSLELRRLPVSILFASEYKAAKIAEDSSSSHNMEAQAHQPQKRSSREEMEDGCLRRTCLNSKLSLRTQMMLSFGIVSAFTIGLVVSVCIAVSTISGNEVNDITRQSFDDLVQSKEGDTARYLAESLSLRLMPTDAVQLLYEASLDRMAGYPQADDSQVPFFDITTQTNRYPVRGPRAPLDWQFEPGLDVLVNSDNQQEHVQDRWSWYQQDSPLSTSRAAYFMQGMCDPSVTDPLDPTYFRGCTDANNNLTTGGVISPTPTNSFVHAKTSDLGPLLKALYEFYGDVKELGLYMKNGGAGGTLVFPHYALNTSTSYVSIGCNWLLEPHPYDPENLIGTWADHERCEADGLHIKGAVVSSRLYNPMDREWCRKQAEDPDKIHVYGPYTSAWHSQEWLMSIGRAMYDRVTQEFIGCIGIDYVLNTIDQAVTESRVTSNSQLTIVQYDQTGSVVSSSDWNMSTAQETVTIDSLDVGVTKETFQDLMNLVDFDSEWDSKQVRSSFESFRVQHDGYLVSAYPMPPPPEEYDPLYRPHFLIVSSISKSDVNAEVENVSESVDDTVRRLEYLCLVAGLAGLGLVTLLIFVVSHSITFPLKYMNDVSSDIVNTFGSVKEEEIQMSRTNSESKCSPRTELSDVVKQFQKMVDRFSGSAMAKSTKLNVTEIDNRFEQLEYFQDVYRSRDECGFKYSYGSNTSSMNFPAVVDSGDHVEEDDDETPTPVRVNHGSILVESTKTETSTLRSSDLKMTKTTYTSPLFFWILALIVTPLFATTVGISAFATYNISRGLSDIIQDAKAEFVVLEQYALLVHAEARANYGALTIRKSTRDNYVLNRYESWLLFGGLDRTDSFTEMISGVEECKVHSNTQDCEAVYDVVCDCDWNDPSGRFGTCDNFESDTRKLQKTGFAGPADNHLPNGDRVSSSFPNTSTSAETTLWWTNVTEVPGAEKDSNASGHETTYDRLRVTSAFPFFQAFYNSEPEKDTFLSNYVFFEADGLGVGFEGCSAGWMGLSHFKSTEANGASRINNDLCPLDKYGYDPRCRDWYAEGRRLALENGSGLYISPPYVFALGRFGQSITSPLIDPVTGEHVGQTLVDFLSQPIFVALDENNTKLAEGGFPVVITGLDDGFGSDTVIGPGFSLVEETSAPIGDVVLPFDGASCPSQECKRRADFEAIRKRMKNGETGTSQFTRTNSLGSVENVYVAFAPINTKMLIPLNSSDITRGVNVSDYLIYSLALAQIEEGFLAAFKDVEDQINKQVNIAIVVLAFLIAFSVVLVFYISSRITLSMIEPMFYLLELIRNINEMDVDDDTPPGLEVEHNYGSREILNVVDTMETLYKIVQSANVAFFAGDVEKAYVVLADAVRLFRRLGNDKAEGVANNNLGNTMLAFYRTMQDSDVEYVSGLSKREIIGKGMGYFHRAIQLGEKAYDEFHQAEGWSPRCLEFMQHLSNRYFNRAMFLLTVKDGHESPVELETLGLRDLQIAKDMDLEIVDQGSEVGWDIRSMDKIFEVYLSRIRGHLILLQLGYEDKWDIDELMDEAFKTVKKEFSSRSASSPLFKEFSPAGRMQQIETELIKYKMLKGDLPCAAKIAIRMLIEDERTLPEAQLKALEAVSAYMESLEAEKGDDDEAWMHAKDQLDFYKLWLVQTKEECDRTRSYTDAESEASLPTTLKKSIRKLNDAEISKDSSSRTRMRMSSLLASTRGDVTMEIF